MYTAIMKVSLQHDAKHDAPGDVQRAQADDEPEQDRLIVFEGQQAHRDRQENQSANEKRGRLYAALSQESLLDETA